MRSLKRIVVIVMMMGMLLSAACMNSMESGVVSKDVIINVCGQYSSEHGDNLI